MPATYNPIIQAELARLQRQKRPNAWRGELPLYFLVAVGILFTLAAPLDYRIQPMREYKYAIVATAALLHVIVVTRTTVLSAQSAGRLSEARRWEDLILTGLNARQIVLGLWRVNFNRAWRWHVASTIVKFGAALVIAGTIQTAMAAGNCEARFPHALCDEYRWNDASVPLLYSLLAAAAMLGAFAVLDAAFSTAVGTFAGIAVHRFHLSVALAVRFGLAAICFIGFFAVPTIARVNREQGGWDGSIWRLNEVLRVISLGTAASSDGGMLLGASQLRAITYGLTFKLQNLASVGIGAASFAVGALGFLYAAQFLAVRRMATCPEVIFRWRAWLRNIPINRAYVGYYLEQFRAQHKRYRWVFYALAVPIGAVIVTQLPIYGDVGMYQIFGIALAVVGLQVLIGIRGVVLASRLSLKTSTASFDEIFSLWWAIVRAPWPFYLLTGVLAFSASLAVADYLYSQWNYYLPDKSIYNLLITYYYQSGLRTYTWFKHLTAFVVWLSFTCANAATWSACIVLGRMIVLRVTSAFWRSLAAVLLRLLILGMAFLFIISDSSGWYSLSGDLLSINSLKALVQPFFDGGIFLTAEMMRVGQYSFLFVMRIIAIILVWHILNAGMVLLLLWLANRYAAQRHKLPVSANLGNLAAK